MRKLIVGNLVNTRQVVGKIGDRYAYSDYELRAFSNLQQQMGGHRDASPPNDKKAAASSAPPAAMTNPVPSQSKTAEDEPAGQASPPQKPSAPKED
jgi:hypothetical protein